jgi:lipopolysaccharide heptosyltransferase III
MTIRWLPSCSIGKNPETAPQLVLPMNILFVTATRIGDAVLSTGLLSYLAERHSGARFTIAAGLPAAPLFATVPGLQRLIAVAKRPCALHWLPLLARVAGQHWDLIVDLRGSALAWMLRAGERRVMAKGDPREHRVRQLARLFDLDPPPQPRLWTAPAHERAAAALLPPGLPLLAIGPAANWRGKQWRAERFAELARRLTSSDGPFAGARIAVMAASHERAQAAPLLASMPSGLVIDLVGRTDLLTAAAVLRRCVLFIGNDTGLMHIAAASGAPTLGLFGPSPAEQYAPWGPYTAVVQTATPRLELFKPDYDHRTTDTLMDSLSVEAVEAAAVRLWQRAASEAA